MKKINLRYLSILLIITAFAFAVSAQPEEIPFFSEIMKEEVPSQNAAWDVRVIEITVRLFIAVILSTALAFRPRRNIPFFQRNLYVAQTQILLAVVAAALMMIVGDSAARAFGIFAAVSLVRFRTNIRDPKEVTVLLISLALGLAAGVGRWELGAVLCLFAVGLLWLLEHNESTQVFRSMELKVKTRDTDATQDMMEKLFKSSKLEAEIREINPPDDGKSLGSIMYFLNLPLSVSTDTLSEKILAMPNHIEGIEWDEQKHNVDIYQ